MSRESPVSQIMTAEVITLTPGETVLDAMQTLVDHDIDGAPVVDDRGRVVGMLTNADLIVQESRLHFPTVISMLGATLELPSERKRFDDDLRKTLANTVDQVMAEDPVCIGVDDTIEEAASLLHEHDVTRLPVVDDRGLVGIVTRTDVLREILRQEREG